MSGNIFLLQGWIPQSMIDAALSGAQFDYIAHMRTRAATIARTDKQSSCRSVIE